MPLNREGYKSANKPDDDDVEGHGGPGTRNTPDEDDAEGHGPFRAVPNEDDVEGHGGPGGTLRYKPEGYKSAATPEDEDTEGHDFRSPASRGE